MEKNEKRFLGFRTIALLLVLLTAWIAWGNTALEVNTYLITSADLPEAFHGLRIAHVSDLHHAEIGKGNQTLLARLKESEPDIIVVTGDLIDAGKSNLALALPFAQAAAEIAPCYYVTGNHEARSTEYDKLKEGLLKANVIVLEDERITLEKKNDAITLIGVNDPSFQTDYLFNDEESVMKSKLERLVHEEDHYIILLSHRPELFPLYAASGIHLVFSGHAHGGQFRLPLIGGIVAPNQGLLPKYDAGIFTDGKTNMVVSRGIGNSIIPFRIGNRPEILLIELRKS